MLDIILVAMPFGPIQIPNLGLGILSSAAKINGFKVKTTFPALRFSEVIDQRSYLDISNDNFSLFGDWLFSFALKADPKTFLRQYDKYFKTEINNLFLKYKIKQNIFTDAKILQKFCSDFLLKEAQKILSFQPKIVGASSSFVQHTASLAILKIIKEANPEIITMLGGANCEAEMGYENAKQFPWVDYIFSGEADTTFVDVCQKIKQNNYQLITNVPYGVYTKNKAADAKTSKYEVAKISDMSKVAIPDYDDYFEEILNFNFTKKANFFLSLGFSRGCAKAVKNPCNFCGLNGAKSDYLIQSEENFLKQLTELSKKYQVNQFALTDNLFSKEALNCLQKNYQNSNHKFMIEVRSNLSRKKINLLKKVGIIKLQAGLENLNDNLLKLLNKGNTAIQNIAFLKFLREESIEIFWNFLHGIPFEKKEDYQELSKLIPLLHHLPPPNFRPILFCKFSTYYKNQLKFDLNLIPLSKYKIIYELPENSIKNLAYHFENINNQNKNSALTAIKKKISQQIKEWNSCYMSKETIPYLLTTEKNNLIKITDSRKCAVSNEFFLDETESIIYKITHSPITFKRLFIIIKEKYKLDANELEIKKIVNELISNKLMIVIGDKYLNLATMY